MTEQSNEAADVWSRAAMFGAGLFGLVVASVAETGFSRLVLVSAFAVLLPLAGAYLGRSIWACWRIAKDKT
jgi:hypothetical protein